MTKDPEMTVEVSGHTDNVGKPEKNKASHFLGPFGSVGSAGTLYSGYAFNCIRYSSVVFVGVKIKYVGKPGIASIFTEK